MPVQAVLAAWAVDAGLGRESVAPDQCAGDFHGQLGPLEVIEFVRQRELELPGNRRIFATLSRLSRRPELSGDQGPVGRVLGSDAARFDDAVPAAVVVAQAGERVLEQQTGTVGGRCDR